MSDLYLIPLCDALTAHLVAAGHAAVRDIFREDIVEDELPLKITVEPLADNRTKMTSGSTSRVYVASVTVSQQAVDTAAVDAMINLCETIKNDAENADFIINGNAELVWAQTEHQPLYDRELLNTAGFFVAQMAFGYQIGACSDG